jgi:hypothetical protein
MYADYKCDSCDETIEVTWKTESERPEEVVCEKCKGTMHRYYGKSGSANIHVPENFKAVNDDPIYNRFKETFKHHHPTDDGRRLKGKGPRGKIFF